MRLLAAVHCAAIQPRMLSPDGRLRLPALSAQLGRRPVTLVAFGILCVSVLCFLASTGAPGLYISRVLNGVAAGLGAGALTAWIAELEPAGNRARAAMFASSGNLAGLALG